MVDIVHECGKEAMMFMGDHWIGMEPFMDEFASIGLDAVVGSVGNGATLRLFSDIKNVKGDEKYTSDGDKLTWNTEDKDYLLSGNNNQRSSGFHGTEILPGRCTDKSK